MTTQRTKRRIGAVLWLMGGVVGQVTPVSAAAAAVVVNCMESFATLVDGLGNILHTR